MKLQEETLAGILHALEGQNDLLEQVVTALQDNVTVGRDHLRFARRTHEYYEGHGDEILEMWKRSLEIQESNAVRDQENARVAQENAERALAIMKAREEAADAD